MNILITSAGQRVSLVRAFQKELKTLYPEAKVYTVDMQPVHLLARLPIADAHIGVIVGLSPVEARDVAPIRRRGQRYGRVEGRRGERKEPAARGYETGVDVFGVFLRE